LTAVTQLLVRRHDQLDLAYARLAGVDPVRGEDRHEVLSAMTVSLS
jgi:hypothetical protein